MTESARGWNPVTLCAILITVFHVSFAEGIQEISSADQSVTLRRTNHASDTHEFSMNPLSHFYTTHSAVSPVHHNSHLSNVHTHTLPIPSQLAEKIATPPVATVGFDDLFPTCKSPCLNGGVCREIKQQLVKCVCPTDYKGDQCEMSSQIPLDFCDETTCQNGGVCTGTLKQPACSCPPDILGRTCERRVRSYEVDLLVTNKSKPMDWNVSLANPLSSAYKNISTKVTKVLEAAGKLGNNLELVKTFYGTEFLGFGNGSLVARIKIKFDLSDDAAQKYTEAMVRQHMVAGGLVILRSEKAHLFQLPTDFGITNSSTFTVKAINPCLTGNNDCSVNAKCTVIAPGVYSCTCKAFTIDSSMNRVYPGRRCVYDGLIIFTFILVGSLVSMLIFLLCGCRRTIWYRYKNRGHPEHLTLVNMPSNYDI